MELKSENLSISVSELGIVESIRLIDREYEFISGAPGYSAVEDCMKERIIGGPDCETPQVETRVENSAIFISRLFPSSGLTIEDIFSCDSGAIRWKVRVSTCDEVPRTAHVYMVLPVLDRTAMSSLLTMMLHWRHRIFAICGMYTAEICSEANCIGLSHYLSLRFISPKQMRV